uniref:Uncharacterized protein n=1 Tax=Anopheles christyi TaxID=43041 RepID=A0A182KHS3_9DIPT
MSSSSPPHPQNEFENPFTIRNCFSVIAETPPKMVLYGSLKPKVSTATDMWRGWSGHV